MKISSFYITVTALRYQTQKEGESESQESRGKESLPETPQPVLGEYSGNKNVSLKIMPESRAPPWPRGLRNIWMIV